MKRLTMTDAEMDEIRSYSPNYDCPVKAENDGCITQKFCDSVCDEFQFDCPFMKMAQKLKSYEDAEDNETLIKLPCKIGEKVYYIQKCLAPSCKQCRAFTRVNNCYTKHKARIFEQQFDFRHIKSFGISVFRTKEEAERALEEMECKA